MQTPFPSNQSLDLNEVNLTEENSTATQNSTATEVTRFHADFQGGMNMFSDVQTVANYLAAHRGWFCRCAQPMEAEPLGENSYILTIGRFGAFGYEVEPKIAVELLPTENYTYPMQTIPVPDYPAPGYEVDYRAVMELKEMPNRDGNESANPITQVTWNLDLNVDIKFPRFIRKLPKSVVQKTGDRLLAKIIRQVSRRLTRKVQADFHEHHNLSLPQES
jgi:hypothetical protein